MTLSEWKQDVVTEEVFIILRQRKADLEEQLVTSAGVNPHIDSFRSGAIAAYKDIVDFHFDEENS